VHSPDVRAKLEAAGMPVVGTSSEEFARMVKDDIETFRKIVLAAGIKPE
jgi:tripartite-type tricarboxylate transporter receptor subunit TctC